MTTTRIRYNDDVVRRFIWASIGWGIIGMLVGAIVALQIGVPESNFGPYLSFGRLRPLHTNAVIFAFVGNMMFAGIYYSSQRLLKARMASDVLSNIHFWGWQAIIVAAAITLPLGFTQGKEYAELEWPIDISIALIWVVFAINFFWTMKNRREKHLYVALWFYMATIVTIAVLHIVNSLAIPVGPLKSYSIFGGLQDALVQWWYGHNAVAFFLTTPILGIMYYFIPKAADRPVFSYRLSIIHFWALVFLYIWAGPHHLLYTALPDWAQTLGMIFSVMLWAPSWGGMLNGLLTLRGAWDRVRTDPVLMFFAAAVTFYGMATFEGPLLSIKSVSGFAHYTDWIIGHVHSGALGWNGFMAAGLFYYLVPKLYGAPLHSPGAARLHFWLGTFGIVIYVAAMWVSAGTQGLMWRAVNPDGGLMYPNFLETVIKLVPLYWVRLVGGLMYLVGMIMMAWNLIKTARAGKAQDFEAEVSEEPESHDTTELAWHQIVFSAPVILTVIVGVLFVLAGISDKMSSIFYLVCAVWLAVLGTVFYKLKKQAPNQAGWHSLLEGKALVFTVLATLSVLVGGVAELVPALVIGNNELKSTHHKPYSPLELQGRDVYLKEGCYTCHSQMIRPLMWETQRYGPPSTAGESIMDHPFQWGSKRTGPDLARVGTKYSPVWHYQHMMNPRDTSPGSIMPGYSHLERAHFDFAGITGKVSAMRSIGVPYTDRDIASASATAQAEARAIQDELRTTARVQVDANSELVALIAYLQRLGKEAPASTVFQASATGGPQ